MCGIVGYFSKEEGSKLQEHLTGAVQKLAKRGPNLQQTKILSPNVGFAHARLSIIDTSAQATQPMTDVSGRYTIIFNGEIFNYRELKNQFLKNTQFISSSDTEVLLNLYIKLGVNCLPLLNGFFAFAIFDAIENTTLIARDRFGIKPLHIYQDDTMILFGSELKALMSFPIKKEINLDALLLYLQLNYIPSKLSIMSHVQKMEPGCWAIITSSGNLSIKKYYKVPFLSGTRVTAKLSYDNAVKGLRKLVEDSVERRLVSDVPLGAFLSGGIDSSIITACAAKRIRHLNTFSIGYKDEPFFDETRYANLVAKRFDTSHSMIHLSNEEVFESIFTLFDYLDEPFADSSAIAMHVLSKKIRKYVTVALSGDGADEMFGGYNKHRAEFLASRNHWFNKILSCGAPLLERLPKSRNSSIGNFFRQLDRYTKSISMTRRERYWNWCAINTYPRSASFLNEFRLKTTTKLLTENLLDGITSSGDLNDVFYSDIHIVLPGDMLVKVDLMSMANSLEVRVPFLDYTVVNYSSFLPASYKLDSSGGKKILKDAFKGDLPDEILHRKKHGFEVPLQKWLRSELRSLVDSSLLEKNFIRDQNIFDYRQIDLLKVKLNSNNPADSHATLWALIVFQNWFKNYFSHA